MIDLHTLKTLTPEKRGYLGKGAETGGKDAVTFKGPVLAVDFSPEDKWLCVGASDNKVTLWRVSDGECYHTFEGHEDWVTSVRFSPDGMNILTASYDGTARIWRVADGHLSQTFSAHGGFVSCAEWDKTGQRIATGSGDHQVRLWTSDSDQPLAVLQGHESWALSVSFSPRGNLLASGGADRMVLLWNAHSMEVIARLADCHADWIEAVSFDSSGSLLATAGHDKNIHVWDVADPASPRQHATLKGRHHVPIVTDLRHQMSWLHQRLWGRPGLDPSALDLLQHVDLNSSEEDPPFATVFGPEATRAEDRAMTMIRDDIVGLDIGEQLLLARIFLTTVAHDGRAPRDDFLRACHEDERVRPRTQLAGDCLRSRMTPRSPCPCPAGIGAAAGRRRLWQDAGAEAPRRRH